MFNDQHIMRYHWYNKVFPAGVALQPSSFDIALSPTQVNLHALQCTPLLQPRRPSVAQGCAYDGHQLVHLCIKGIILRYDAIGDVNRECLQRLQGSRNVGEESEKKYLSLYIWRSVAQPPPRVALAFYLLVGITSTSYTIPAVLFRLADSVK